MDADDMGRQAQAVTRLPAPLPQHPRRPIPSGSRGSRVVVGLDDASGMECWPGRLDRFSLLWSSVGLCTVGGPMQAG
jgi:hypothetical protein